jgi:hypothetical protein
MVLERLSVGVVVKHGGSTRISSKHCHRISQIL